MIQMAPSILSADFSRLGDQVKLVEEAGAEVLHIDIMDGHFVPNLTFGPALVKSIRDHSRMRFDVHLMVDEPEKFIADFAAAGADHITFHLETTPHVHRVIQQIKEHGMTAGIALNPATPLDGLKYILEDLDMVLLMTVNPGFGGQKFIPNVIPKIQVLHHHLLQTKSSCLIEVDGGINLETASVVAKAGAHILVAGAAVFAQPDPQQAVKNIRQAASVK
ncbi:ribulose-phosphate 3-epimerase [Desulfosporosinus nitroreducens]|uniref:Ribulose-phosphate 3-epimerase n=1 Tax=Desulfosporosinus nitroreducens TaxID=2018668 RepID=A0ABT8QK12_9FIRM|nr:ribulose-phosphate 3-epimerase [Desulfosporosinus nitroreducens]MCO1601157.1 ribulose-phosphate 3-epimerase [Desulfosporosinus nitroreducens]MDO0821661.1 ribulose-phosphate 3-epimerase [Desulfosporosinus nitroreducens]